MAAPKSARVTPVAMDTVWKPAPVDVLLVVAAEPVVVGACVDAEPDAEPVAVSEPVALPEAVLLH